MTTYTTVGSVRGWCGHHHQTIAEAVRCLHADARICARQGGYSDRRVERTDGAEMTDAELQEWEEAESK